MAKLSTAERQLLRYPPTPETWACGRKTKTIWLEDGQPLVVEHECQGLMSGSYESCTFCRQPKRRGAKKLWPLYEAACKKAGIEATGQPVRPTTTPAATPTAPKRRKKG